MDHGTKLVRDEIPVLYPQHTYRRTSETERGLWLRLKLAEETGEVLSAPTREALLVELADVLEVVRALAQHSGLTIQDVVDAAQAKAAERGGFDEGWLLV